VKAKKGYGPEKQFTDYGIDVSSPKLSIEDFFEFLERAHDISRERAERYFPHALNRNDDQIFKNLGLQPLAIQNIKRKLKNYFKIN